MLSALVLRLWARYLGLVLVYTAQTSLLLVAGTRVLTPLLPVSPTAGAVSPALWFWLSVMPLATLSLVSGLLIEALWHRPERWLYRNHGLSFGFLAGSAVGVFWGALCSAGLVVAQRQGLLPWRWLTPGEWQAWGVYLAQQALSTYAWALVCLVGILGVAGLVVLIAWLSLDGVFRMAQLPPDAAPNWRLQIDSVSHHFGRRRVLSGAWLHVQNGRVLGLLGRNGCGKSTLLQILFGSLKADNSVVQLNGIVVKRLYQQPEAAAYLPQASFLPRRWRVERALTRFAGAAAEPLRTDIRLAPLLQTRIAELSGGERRYLELCLVLALPRAFYLLDEPFSELEPLYKQAAGVRIRAASETAGVIVTDHDYAQILAVSDEVMLMHQGQTQRVEHLAELRGRYLPGARPGFAETESVSFEEN